MSMENLSATKPTPSFTTPRSILHADPASLSHSFYLSLHGATDVVLPLDDAPDTPYLSHMERPLDTNCLDVLASTATPLDALLEQEVEPMRHLVLTNFDWFWGAIEHELTERQFQIFQLYHMYGYPQWRVAEILQLKGGQAVVAQILHVCESRLRKRLSPLLSALLSLP